MATLAATSTDSVILANVPMAGAVHHVKDVSHHSAVGDVFFSRLL